MPTPKYLCIFKTSYAWEWVVLEWGWAELQAKLLSMENSSGIYDDIFPLILEGSNWIRAKWKQHNTFLNCMKISTVF